MSSAETAEGTPHSSPPPATSPRRPKLTLLPLIALIFFDVSGGPFGVEDSVGSGGGPLLSLLGFLIFPLLWSLPEALITAELSALFPSNGGYVVWISSAFSPFWGFQQGIWKFVSGAMDNALYPVLFLDYLKRSLPFFSDSSPGRPLALFTLTAALTFLNYRGLHIVGFSAIALTFFSLSPFIVLSVLAIPRIRPYRWLSADIRGADWRGYFNSMFWNLNYWDKASALAGEVEEPSRTFPRAIFGAVGLVMASYLIPLLAGTGAIDGSKSGEWSDGYFAQVGLEIGGEWLRWWIQAAAAMSNMGLFEAEMSSDSFQLLGMSEMGMIPEIFSKRSKYGTPTVSILCSATGVLLLSWMSFQQILEFLNFLYALGMLLEFAAFIKLRVSKPHLHRPYKVPVGTFWATVMCFPPAFLLLLVMCLASFRTFAVSGAVFLLGIILHPIMQFLKDKKWVKFVILPPENLGNCNADLPVLDGDIADESSVSLL
ncbi:probable polyamine transporter At3g19553 [Phalaenopsis equestris]|uniref:probable polyamine transporter At3g19553 n=1 Tax=Phalaenopsis equestris TaxID=78828 RepID=UPI0009E37F0C|nr:probable polyamine transporter At3g19553 [Phalaenopsis equestris]